MKRTRKKETCDRRDFLRGAMTGAAALGACAAMGATSNAAPAWGSGVSPLQRSDAPAWGSGVSPLHRFDVRGFGAKGDGKTPDSAAIQKALDAAGKVQGAVFFPPGVYRCHDLKAPPHVTLLADPAWIFRTEKAGAVLELDDANARCLLDVTGAFGVRVHGLTLNGIRKTPKPVHGIFLDNRTAWSAKEDTFVCDDAKVMNFSGHGVYLNRVWLFIIRHGHFMGNGGDGVCVRGWDGFVTDNQFSANGGNGFGCQDVGATVMFTANRVEWNKGYGLSLVSGDDWNVTGNSFDRNWGAGLCAAGTRALAVTGNVFRRCGKDSAQLAEGETSCHVRLSNVRGLTMTGNAFLAGRDDGGKGKFTPQAGILVEKMAYSTIANNTLYRGYMKEKIVDRGGHGPEFVMKDNVGCVCS